MRPDPNETAPRMASYAKDPEAEGFFAALNDVLAEADLPAQPVGESRSLPIIYIVGTPRSGTTLLSQIASRHLPVGYINNLIARFWLRPSVGIRLSLEILGEAARERLHLKSSFGVTSCPEGPHEFGYFWRHWLKLDPWPTHHLPAEGLHAVDGVGLKRALEREILAPFGAPVVFKNLICGFHAGFLTELHPSSLFVMITRDEFATARSILASRKARYGDFGTWWSLKPSTWPFPGAADAVDEVIRQVRDCRAETEAELDRPGVHAMRTTYEDLCADPGSVLREICGRLASMGAPMRPLSEDYPALAPSQGQALPEAVERRLREALNAAPPEETR